MCTDTNQQDFSSMTSQVLEREKGLYFAYLLSSSWCVFIIYHY